MAPEDPPGYAVSHDDDAPWPTDELAIRRGTHHWDHDAENGIIGALLYAPADQRAAIVAAVTVDDFTLNRNRLIWTIAPDLATHDGPLTPAAVADHLGTRINDVGHHELRALYEQGSTLNWTSWANILRRHTRTRHALAHIAELDHAVRTGNDWATALGKLENLAVDDTSNYRFTVVPYGDTETIDPPAYLRCTDGHALIYPGRHHDIHGEPGDGKSWAALAACRDVLDQGHAITWVDWEDTRGAFDNRMLALGVHQDVLNDPTRVTFIRPEGAWNDTDRAGLLEHARRNDSRLVCFDAMTDALSMEGRNENDPHDVNQWLTNTCKPLNRAGIATLIIDHVPKSTENRPRGARGSGDKLGVIDGVSYALKLTRPYDKNHAGEVRLVIEKDRHGYVGPRGKTVARITIEPTDEGRTITLTTHRVNDSTDASGRFTPTLLMERISRFLEARPGEELSGRRIVTDVKGDDKHLRTALEILVEQGHLAARSGPRNSTLYTLLEPYAQPPETDTPEPTAERGATAVPARWDRGPATAVPPPPPYGAAPRSAPHSTPHQNDDRGAASDHLWDDDTPWPTEEP